MKLNIDITDALLEKILSYGDVILEDLSEDELNRIKSSMEDGIISRIDDEPHYAFGDYIEGII